MTDTSPPEPLRSPARAESADVHRLHRRLRETERLLQAREEELALLKGSHSFRLTAPLRWLRRRLSGEAGPTSALDAVLLREDSVPPALRAFPTSMVKRDPPDRLNDSHRPLRMDEALQPLVCLKVVDGALDEQVSPFDVRYHGDSPQPIRMATVAGPELRQELSFDAAVLPLHSARWKEQLDAHRVDLVLLDGAWDPEGGWGAGFGSSPESRRRVQPLLEHCRQNSVPVVLWAREDAGDLGRLQWLFPLVSRVYAIDDAGFEKLRREFPDLGAGLLPVAVQPALYNPVRSYGLKGCGAALADTALFDGWWALSTGLGNDPTLVALGDRLRVTDSDGDYSWARLQDNARHAPLSLGSLTPLEKSALLRAGSVELFLPHAASRPWRQANHMIRTAASGARMLWGGEQHCPPWAGAVQVSGDDVAGQLGTLKTTTVVGARRAHLAFREVFTHHCIADRLAVVARDLGIGQGAEATATRVAHLLVTMRPQLLEQCLTRFRADQYAERELVVVLHGDGIDVTAAKALVRPGEPVRVLSAGADRSLGECLNMAIAHTDAPFWMKLDDDDHYGPAYTQDMLLYRRAIRTPLMGKPPAFVHLEGEDEVRWDPQWALHANLLHDPREATSALVAGGTLAGTREVLDSMRFSGARRGGSDSEFIERCLQEGHSLLAADAFNFARYRSAAEGFHTWKVADDELRKRSVLLGTHEALYSQVFV